MSIKKTPASWWCTFCLHKSVPLRNVYSPKDKISVFVISIFFKKRNDYSVIKYLKWNGSVEHGYVKRSFYAGNRPMAEIGGCKLFCVFLGVLNDLHIWLIPLLCLLEYKMYIISWYTWKLCLICLVMELLVSTVDRGVMVHRDDLTINCLIVPFVIFLR